MIIHCPYGRVAAQLAQFKIMCGDQGDDPRLMQMTDGTCCTVNAIRAVCTLKNLIDQNQHRLLLSACLIHLLNAQNFRIKGRYSLAYIIMYTHRGKQVHAACTKGIGTDSGACMHQHKIDAQRS